MDKDIKQDFEKAISEASAEQLRAFLGYVFEPVENCKDCGGTESIVCVCESCDACGGPIGECDSECPLTKQEQD